MLIRFHLDEHLPWAVAEALRRRGIDVTTTPDADLFGAADPAQLAFALGEQRVMVTHDADFLRHAARGIPHAGIAFCHSEKYQIGGLIRRRLELHERAMAEDVQSRIEYL